jgi:hypothetical protein
LLRYYQLSTKMHDFTQNPPMMNQCRFWEATPFLTPSKNDLKHGSD